MLAVLRACAIFNQKMADGPDPWEPMLTRRSSKRPAHQYVLTTPKVPCNGVGIQREQRETRRNSKRPLPVLGSPGNKKKAKMSEMTSNTIHSTSDTTQPQNEDKSNYITVMLYSSETRRLWQIGEVRSPSDYNELDQCLSIFDDIYSDTMSSGNHTHSVKKCLSSFEMSVQVDWIEKIRQAHLILAVTKQMEKAINKRTKLLIALANKKLLKS